jgi:NADPH2:quinone reductase
VTLAGPGQLVVGVKAAGLNRADLTLFERTGSVAGRELAGEVLEVGRDVHGWAVGDRLMARGPGLQTEHVVVSARLAMPVPDSLTWEEAGALPVALLTLILHEWRWVEGCPSAEVPAR